MSIKVELMKLTVQIVTLVITAFIVPALMSWLNQKAEDAQLNRVKGWALKAVKAAEQVYKDYEKSDPDGVKRRSYARRVLKRACQRCKICLTDEDIETLIEAAVHEINNYSTFGIPLNDITDPADFEGETENEV